MFRTSLEILLRILLVYPVLLGLLVRILINVCPPMLKLLIIFGASLVTTLKVGGMPTRRLSSWLFVAGAVLAGVLFVVGLVAVVWVAVLGLSASASPVAISALIP